MLYLSQCNDHKSYRLRQLLYVTTIHVNYWLTCQHNCINKYILQVPTHLELFHLLLSLFSLLFTGTFAVETMREVSDEIVAKQLT